MWRVCASPQAIKPLSPLVPRRVRLKPRSSRCLVHHHMLARALSRSLSLSLLSHYLMTSTRGSCLARTWQFCFSFLLQVAAPPQTHLISRSRSSLSISVRGCTSLLLSISPGMLLPLNSLGLASSQSRSLVVAPISASLLRSERCHPNISSHGVLVVIAVLIALSLCVFRARVVVFPCCPPVCSSRSLSLDGHL